jgi:hypothetical protein
VFYALDLFPRPDEHLRSTRRCRIVFVKDNL